MTVSELIAQLVDYPPEAVVLIQLVGYDRNEYRHVTVLGEAGRAGPAVVLAPGGWRS